MIIWIIPGDVNRKFQLSNRSNSIETNRTDWWNQSKSIKYLHFFFRLIGFDWLQLTSIDLIDQFNWVWLIRSISSIEFDRFELIGWINQTRSNSIETNQRFTFFSNFDWFRSSVQSVSIEFDRCLIDIPWYYPGHCLLLQKSRTWSFMGSFDNVFC